MVLVSLIRVESAALILSEQGNGVSETRDPEVVASWGGACADDGSGACEGVCSLGC